MKHAVWLVLVAGLCVVGCNGSHHTGTEPSAAPIIANLKALTFIRSDASTGILPVSFDYADTDADVSQVLVTFPEGTATNPAEGTAGHTSGTISFLQAVHLPDPTAHQLAFSVQVVDSAGHHSNTLQGQANIP
jgi:hypothetical protein